ncbi:hypothetical protein SCUP515_13303 [Seiridium cupressi]
MSVNPKGLEKRREQNRLAQRRFRAHIVSCYSEKHGHRKASEQQRRTSNANLDNDQYKSRPGDVLPEAFNSYLQNSIEPSNESNGQDLCGDDTHGFLEDLDFDAVDNLLMSDQGLDATSNASPPDLGDQDGIERVLKHFRCASQVPSQRPSTGNGTSNNLANSGPSPLHLAVQKGNQKIVRMLLEHDADCNAKDMYGMTPLVYATIKGSEEVADLLLSHGAGICHVDYYDRTALHWAVLQRRDRFLKKLLKHCADDADLINGYARDGKNALHIAIDSNFEAAVEVLLKSGADVQYKARWNEEVHDDNIAVL